MGRAERLSEQAAVRKERDGGPHKGNCGGGQLLKWIVCEKHREVISVRRQNGWYISR